jgi:hypothetical protein
MDRQSILFTTFIFLIVFTVYGQSPVDQRVQQLREAWEQKAKELSELGIKIAEKEKFIESLRNDAKLFVEKIASNYSQQEKEALIKKVYSSAKDFTYSLLNAIHNNINVQDFFIKELIDNKGDYSLQKERVSAPFDKVKFITIKVNVEFILLQKLIKDYGKCLHNMAEFERELVSLGEPWLSRNDDCV